MHTEAERRRSFSSVLVNTFIANLTTSFLWQCVVFWMYLETRNVLVTAILGGAYLLGFAVFGVPFGSWIDRTRKRTVMLVAQGVTLVFFLLAALLYFLTPRSVLLTLGSGPFVVFVLVLLAGGIMESARGIALSTVVTLLIPDERRDRANGLVGMVNGLSFMVTAVVAGLAIGQLGMTTSLLLAVGLTVASFVHMLTVDIPEPRIVHADGAPRPVDFAGAWRAIREVPALIWLIVFSTFNNFVGGVFMALLDPYGLTLVSVETWGILFGVLGTGFLAGGAIIGKWGLGSRPLRTLLVANSVMWVTAGAMAIRESVVLLAVGIFAYMALVPFIEAAEQTVLQRVVPLPKQGRVFGFAQSLEVAAAPISSFLIGPIAQFGLIPYMGTPHGRAAWGWLLGDGHARGIALVFVLSAVVGLVITVGALASRPYRVLSRSYADAVAPSGSSGDAA